jgi:hypothetical protein
MEKERLRGIYERSIPIKSTFCQDKEDIFPL